MIHEIQIATHTGSFKGYAAEDVLPLIESGVISRDQLCWKPGMESWQPLRTLFPEDVIPQVTEPTLLQLQCASPWYARALKYGLWGFIFTKLLWLIHEGLHHWLELQESLGDEAIEVLMFVHNFEDVLMMGQVVFFPVLSGIYLAWVHQIHRNAQHFGAIGMRHSTWKTLICHGIPVLHLVLPYRAFQEAWKVSCDPEHWQLVSRNGWIQAWWTSWVVSQTLFWIWFTDVFLLQGESGLAAFAFGARLLVDIPLACLLMRVVTFMERQQESLVRASRAKASSSENRAKEASRGILDSSVQI